MDIEFGDVKEAKPNRDLRPDQDAHYAVLPVGDLAEILRGARATNQPADDFHIDDDGDAFNNQLNQLDSSDSGATQDAGYFDDAGLPDDELKIYVDLDVMRAMEVHAASNTRVELGGVVLGYQRVDDEGKPFVVVTECLQAEHYEAAKTSFKFTHDTWSKITDDRENFHPDLEMVGWYHTHPGFGIFLSGMDLFICNNFFSRDLDVALVIDPKGQERGWFQWVTEGQQRKTRETRGFYLMTNRYRKDELEYFANFYAGGQAMNFDPRLSNYSSSGGQPVINISENRRPVFELGVLAMLMMQFLFVGLVAWKMLLPGQPDPTLQSTVNQQAYDEIIGTIVDKQTGKKGVLDTLKEAKLENTRLKANLDGLVLRGTELTGQIQQSNKAIESLTQKNDELRKDKLKLKKENASLQDILKEEGIDPGHIGWLKWVWATLGGIAMAVVGGVVGFFIGMRKNDFDRFEDEAFPEPDRDNSGSRRRTDGGDQEREMID